MTNKQRFLSGLPALIVVLCSAYQSTGFCRNRSVEVTRVTRNTADVQRKTQTEAAGLWEQAIEAKGGRERLYSIYNMVVSAHQDYTTHKGRKNRVRREALYVFPNKYWFYDDYGPDVFGIGMHMYNYDTGMQYVGGPGDPQTRLEPINKTTERTRHEGGPITLLLETRWLKPIPLKARAERIGLKKVDVVQTDINGTRVDFALDRKTHLPIEVRFYDVVDNKTYIDVQRLSDYTEVSAIKVPQTVKLSDGTLDKSVIQFNVKYNEDIFTNPPTRIDPETWRPKNKE